MPLTYVKVACGPQLLSASESLLCVNVWGLLTTHIDTYRNKNHFLLLISLCLINQPSEPERFFLPNSEQALCRTVVSCALYGPRGRGKDAMTP